MEEAHADADFYINDGRSQPGCKFDEKAGASCEHERVNQIWTSSLGWFSTGFRLSIDSHLSLNHFEIHFRK